MLVGRGARKSYSPKRMSSCLRRLCADLKATQNPSRKSGIPATSANTLPNATAGHMISPRAQHLKFRQHAQTRRQHVHGDATAKAIEAIA